MKKWPGAVIKIGTGPEIDEDVIIGYPSGRLKGKGTVSIGPKACMRSGTVIYQKVVIGGNFQSGHNVVVREENRIGKDVCIWANSVIDYGCKIGNNVKIHTGVYVAQYTMIEDDVFIAPGTVFANDKYPLSPHLEGPIVRKGARIGVNCTILPGVEIGEGALVGAGSVVTKDVPPQTVVAGNPARVISSAAEIRQKMKIKKEKVRVK